MKWKTKLQVLLTILIVAGYVYGYFCYRSFRITRATRPDRETPEPTFDGVKRVVFKPMEFLEKMTKDTPLDFGRLASEFEKKQNPDGPPLSEGELSERFIQAHKEAKIEKIRKLFYGGYIPDDDVRQIVRYFDYAITNVEFADLPPGVTAHSNFEGDLVVTRMMKIYYGAHSTMFPKTARFYVGTIEDRHFLVIRWGKG